jgi:hypothetical protein
LNKGSTCRSIAFVFIHRYAMSSNTIKT